jgi:hypothetical protein
MGSGREGIADLSGWTCVRCGREWEHPALVSVVLRARLNGSRPIYSSDQMTACACGWEVSSGTLVDSALFSQYPSWLGRLSIVIGGAALFGLAWWLFPPVVANVVGMLASEFVIGIMLPAKFPTDRYRWNEFLRVTAAGAIVFGAAWWFLPRLPTLIFGGIALSFCLMAIPKTRRQVDRGTDR